MMKITEIQVDLVWFSQSVVALIALVLKRIVYLEMTREWAVVIHSPTAITVFDGLLGAIHRTLRLDELLENQSESNSDGIAFSVKGKCIELSWIWRMRQRERRTFFFFWGCLDEN